MFGLPAGIRACLFDMDGVLTRTATLHQAAWRQVFNEFLQARHPEQRPFTQDDYNRYVDGKPRADGVRDFLASRGIRLPESSVDDPPGTATVHGLARYKDELFLQQLADRGVGVFPGSARYLRAVREADLRTAVVTASVHGAEVLAASGLAYLVDVRIDGVVAARDGLRGKPAPDGFLAAAQALGVPPAQAAVFEDALAGVAAGRAGGFGYVVGVDRTGQAAELRTHGADVVVTDLGQLLND
ncbi:beta-phosphoglucomutase family hydrolase [Blastococcus sp. MG754426]|uniref:HAD family hydrolase n=1 Tax=unclassified Blastococcus TaxID=2619396 RepID=UPI001EF0203D|nr:MULTISPECIES: beta-phosphoglucomutase family hydrolase [unclassified Blastococcus]MCF6507455.1 beta-phosphoglucomutase family hydrolase [Blastococcus sp. MG754426]MCF6512572.1 beta-phosphoglucomutase family hydrolase [Blastococcus sp. MG754427]